MAAHSAQAIVGFVLIAAVASCRPSAPAPDRTGVRDVLIEQAIEALRTAQRKGDVTHHVRADALATELIDGHGPDATSLALRAAARSGLHRFAEAADAARAAVSLNPHDTAAHGVLADALVELGNYEAAIAAVQRMIELRPSHAAYARAAYLRVLHGDQAGGLRLMRLALEATPSNAAAERVWHLEHLGRDAIAAGDHASASRAFAQALALAPEHGGALEGLAALAAARGDSTGAIALYERAIAAGPAPDAHAALVDLYTALGRDEDAAAHFVDAERLERDELAAPGRPEGRHLAILLLDRGVQLDEALRLAERDAAGRNDVYTQDTLAWALYRNGRIDDAARAAARALRLGTRDPLLLYHAGMIAAAVGDVGSASRWLAAAIDRPAALGPLRARHARDAQASLTRHSS